MMYPEPICYEHINILTYYYIGMTVCISIIGGGGGIRLVLFVVCDSAYACKSYLY